MTPEELVILFGFNEVRREQKPITGTTVYSDGGFSIGRRYLVLREPGDCDDIELEVEPGLCVVQSISGDGEVVWSQEWVVFGGSTALPMTMSGDSRKVNALLITNIRL